MENRAGAVSIESVGGLSERWAEWSVLAAASGNVFFTPEWLSSWWDAFDGSAELALKLCRRADGSPLALLPLYRDRRLGLLRLMGNPVSDLTGAICAPGDRELAMDALRQLLAERGARAFVSGPVAVSEGWPAAIGGEVLDREPSPTLAFEGRRWDEILADWSSNFRGQIRRLERRLGRDHDVHWRLADSSTLEVDLETLFALHRARWEGVPTDFLGRWEALHRRFAPLALERGWLRLTVLELDGVPAGATYNLRFGSAESFYQAGRDPAFDRLRLGLALQVHAIRAAVDDGLDEYRFLRGDEPYKERFANRDDAVESVVVPLQIGGWALARATRSLSRFGPVRYRLMRWLG